MSYNIFITHRFEKELKRLAKKHPSLKKDFSNLLDKLSKSASTGVSIGKNCYKIRLNITSKGKGKRGGARVITYLYIQTETLYLLTIYDKGEKSTLRPKELKEMIANLDLG
jgi:mRNA-degrading endonuclease RelE of RelBE toxin-antitoxin system